MTNVPTTAEQKAAIVAAATANDPVVAGFEVAIAPAKAGSGAKDTITSPRKGGGKDIVINRETF